jgi:hypothetical protein
MRWAADANRCADPTAAAAVGVLTERYGPPINRYAFADPAGLEHTLRRVLAWDEATPGDYDHRWINLHGMAAVLGGDEPLSLPADERPAPAQLTRASYRDQLAEVLRRLRGRTA